MALTSVSVASDSVIDLAAGKKASRVVETNDVSAVSVEVVATGTEEDGEDDVEWEDVDAPETEKPSAAPVSLPTDAEQSNEDSDEGSEEDENDEMYLSLKNELEDAKAEEDLEELRDEALKSALATASNLT